MVAATNNDPRAWLTDTERAELEAIERLKDPEPLADFAGRLGRKYAAVPPHLKPIYDLIERSRREQIYATISEPPRHGKTTTFAIGMSYRVSYDPACNNFYTTYAQKRADNFGAATMRIIEQLGIPFDKHQHSADFWKTVFGGGLMSTSKGGPITGEGANGGIVLCDDILKGWKESRSKSARDDAYNYVTTDVMSRIEGGASFMLINTRWHDDDVIGRIKKNPLGLGQIAGTKPWIHINLPAIHDGNFNPVDERAYPDKAHPLWLDVDSANPNSREAAMRWYALARARGELPWWALYQGTPRKEGSKVFGNPSRYTLPMSKASRTEPQPFNWRGKRGCVVMDPAATESTKADHTAIAVVAMEGSGIDAVGYLVDAYKAQISVPRAARLALEWSRRYRLPLVIEGVAGFKSVRQIIEEMVPGIRINNAPAYGSKFTRAQPVSGAWNDGRFLIPVTIDMEGRPLKFIDDDEGQLWIDSITDQAQEFTGDDGIEDDMIDCIAHGWNFLHAGSDDRAARSAE